MDHRKLPLVGRCLTRDGLDSKGLRNLGDHIDGGLSTPRMEWSPPASFLCLSTAVPHHPSCMLSLKTKQSPYTLYTLGHGDEYELAETANLAYKSIP